MRRRPTSPVAAKSIASKTEVFPNPFGPYRTVTSSPKTNVCAFRYARKFWIVIRPRRTGAAPSDSTGINSLDERRRAMGSPNVPLRQSSTIVSGLRCPCTTRYLASTAVVPHCRRKVWADGGRSDRPRTGAKGRNGKRRESISDGTRKGNDELPAEIHVCRDLRAESIQAGRLRRNAKHKSPDLVRPTPCAALCTDS